MISLRRFFPFLAAGSVFVAAACMPDGGGLDFSIRSTDGWVGLPIEQLFLRPSLDAELLAACFETSCEEPAAVIGLRARGKDARALMATFNDPKSLAVLLNQSDAEDKNKIRRAIKTTATAERLSIAGLPAFKMSLLRADKPEKAFHAAAVAKDEGDTLRIILAVGRREDVALANAEAAASDLLK
jgi:hypothetical protein